MTGAGSPGSHDLNKMEERQRNKARVCGYEYLRVPCGEQWQDVMKHERVRWRAGRGLWRFIKRQPCEWMWGGWGHVWVERRDCPAAGTDATLVRLHFPVPNATERASARECVNITTRQPPSDETCSHTFLMSPTQPRFLSLFELVPKPLQQGSLPTAAKRKKVM